MPEDQTQAPPGVDFKAQTIKFDYIKGNYFRVVHVDGAFGGNSPRGDIRMSVWNERWPIPKQTTYKLQEGGKLGDEIREERITREAVVREVEVELVMDIEVAKTIQEWLKDKINKAEAEIKASEEGEQE